MQRFFLQPEILKSASFELEERNILEQMQRVLRMQPGDRFIALDNSGDEYVCEIEKLGRSIISRIVEKRQNVAEPKIKLRLFQALPKKPALFEMVLQKCTEIGVSDFFPLITERTERHELPKPERLHKIIQEAAEQSGRGKLPVLHEPVQFKTVVTKGSSVLSPEAKNFLTRSAEISIDLFIGPEGGFSQQEIALAVERGATIAGLGPRTLRTETAAIVACGLVLHCA